MGKVHITLTVNLKDGNEINDIEGQADNLSFVSDEVEVMLDHADVSDDEWSSLVVIVVASEA